MTQEQEYHMQHSSKRARSRYGLVVWESELSAISHDIYWGLRCCHVKDSFQGRQLVLVQYKGKELAVVFDRPKKCIVTFLPSIVAKEWSEEIQRKKEAAKLARKQKRRKYGN